VFPSPALVFRGLLSSSAAAATANEDDCLRNERMHLHAHPPHFFIVPHHDVGEEQREHRDDGVNANVQKQLDTVYRIHRVLDANVVILRQRKLFERIKAQQKHPTEPSKCGHDQHQILKHVVNWVSVRLEMRVNHQADTVEESTRAHLQKRATFEEDQRRPEEEFLQWWKARGKRDERVSELVLGQTATGVQGMYVGQSI
jgi:hypothetical protein